MKEELVVVLIIGIATLLLALLTFVLRLIEMTRKYSVRGSVIAVAGPQYDLNPDVAAPGFRMVIIESRNGSCRHFIPHLGEEINMQRQLALLAASTGSELLCLECAFRS